MGIILRSILFCDRCDVEWDTPAPSLDDSGRQHRREARADGWRRVHFGPAGEGRAWYDLDRAWYDLCSECAGKRDAEKAAEKIRVTVERQAQRDAAAQTPPATGLFAGEGGGDDG